MDRCPDPDVLLELLSAHRRRHTIRCLRRHGPMTLADLADEIAVFEAETTIDEVPPEDVRDVYLSLYHAHLPKLEGANVLEYDQEQDAVALRDWGNSELRVTREFARGDDAEVGDGITVELSVETIRAMHREIRRNDALDQRMSYDELIRAMLTDRGD